ncbi:hypothetical protein SFC66_07045 [Terribacillus saccharophilus]|uniref:hypothetical protein n=1 Tax=Terribacillus saccharophilus TaxID=361277 RepID=UPI003982C0C8
MRGSDAQQQAFAASRLDSIRHRGEPASLMSDAFVPGAGGMAEAMERKKIQERLKQS